MTDSHERRITKFLKDQQWFKTLEARKAGKKQSERNKERKKRRAQRKEYPSAKFATPIPKLGKPHPDYKADDAFYRTREWKQLRYLALRECGFACQICGARPSDGITLHVDHVKPRYRYPHLSLCLDNLGVACQDCNIGKGAWDETDYRVHFKSI